MTKIISTTTTGFTENARKLAQEISVDKTECSVSFNEFLALNGKQKTTSSPSDMMLEIFDMFDHEKSGKIPEMMFRKIMARKFGGDTAEIEEMLEEYRRIHSKSDPETPVGEEYIDYRKFVSMLEE